MNRKAFLKTIGASAAFAVSFPCLHGCSSDSGDSTIDDEVETPTNIDFTIDLNSEEASNLADNGGFILKNLVVVARNLEGDYVAATQICSHEANEDVRFVTDDGEAFYYCSVHGSRFAQDGTPLNQVDENEAKPLTIYNIELLDGDLLHVFE
ncbi:Rieske 2Fe-2S domain-containing protein [Cellulophaga baltica]|uniref:QcrA and Rieske domain-containing protein n=1 Tax=Cellulophaga TaxID=104264 RepID=UPI001C0652BA|nr:MULTISPECIES: Rieske 2Fe-2S domain-containing protein [Cellulophaga]MBU2996911.1 Rieske 2Fe-2S domain-containing protein [Cellulophaga baltica]MDO6768309.1 Rieske 2Fe-2S domain-containing protein [Cellulophaga sp. 1_MG-2023]